MNGKMKAKTPRMAIVIMVASLVMSCILPTAAAVNDDPVVEAGSDEYKNAIFYTASTADRTVVSTATDDFTVSNTTWSMDSGPGIITWGAQWTTNTSIVADTEGTYVLNLTATDNESATSYDIFTLVWDTTDPSVEAGSDESKNAIFYTTNPNDRTIRTGATDTGSGMANYTWAMDSGTGTVTWGAQWALNSSVTVSADGDYVLNITITDNAGNSAYDTFTLSWDATAPTITTVTPEDGATNYAVASGTYVIYFSEAMDTAQSGFTSNLPGASASWDESTRYYNITYIELDDGTVYHVNLTGHGHTDMTYGNALGGDLYKTFTTTSTAGTNTAAPAPSGTTPVVDGDSTDSTLAPSLGWAFWVGSIMLILGFAMVPIPYIQPLWLKVGGILLIVLNFLM